MEKVLPLFFVNLQKEDDKPHCIRAVVLIVKWKKTA
jgi:hypothetical protein